MKTLNDLTPEFTTPQSRDCRESFIFYASFYEAMRELPIITRARLYDAITEYALFRTEPELKGVAKGVWELIKPQLDANWRKYERGCKGAEFGKLGGRPSKKPLDAISETPKEKEKVKEKENVNVKVAGERDTKNIYDFSFSDIVSYIDDNNLNVEAHVFWDYYASNGWKIGENPMVDWQAALRYWSSKEISRIPTNQPQQPTFKPHYNDL